MLNLNPNAPTRLSRLQLSFLTGVVESKKIAAVYLKSGIQLKSRIIGFDAKSLLLSDPHLQVIHLSAVSTIAPVFQF